MPCNVLFNMNLDESSEDEVAGNGNERPRRATRDRIADDLFLDQSQMDAGVCYFLGLWRLL